MVQLIKLLAPRNESTQDLYDKELKRLMKKGALEKRLTDIDKTKAFRRIYVMGCGRSGTWLLTGVMSTFNDVEVVVKELAVEHFGLFQTDRSILILKRDSVAYQRIKEIPQQIEIVFIVRHPFDVLTSHLPISRRPYHILPHRWLGEMLALQYLLDTGRKNTKIIRYEDLVSKPVESQRELARFFTLQIRVPLDQVVKMDQSSIGKYKLDTTKIQYLQRIKPDLGDMLSWVAKTYNYDVSLESSAP
jgi:hypothetical protein